ncbi:hypothetical protein LINPERHAP1_LOCUS5006 [Linum perenne]
MDRWIPEAGRSNLLSHDDVLWIVINGIPIHLRSVDLFRHLGLLCGEFLDFEEVGSLSSVRIKVRLVGALPESVSINYRDRAFWVKVTHAVSVSPAALQPPPVQ